MHASMHLQHFAMTLQSQQAEVSERLKPQPVTEIAVGFPALTYVHATTQCKLRLPVMNPVIAEGMHTCIPIHVCTCTCTMYIVLHAFGEIQVLVLHVHVFESSIFDEV